MNIPFRRACTALGFTALAAGIPGAVAAAQKANPCAAQKPAAAANPCAAKNPCAAAANPCSAAGEAVELTDDEAKVAGSCISDEMNAAYAKSTLAVAKAFAKWPRYSAQPYFSATHGQRYVQNFANNKAKAYGKFEKAGKMPVGAQVAKNSFAVSPDGHLSVGPLFLMEKMPAGFLKDSSDWKYTMIMPDGSLYGETKGQNSEGMKFCFECHQNAAEHDQLFFLPAEYRAKR